MFCQHTQNLRLPRQKSSRILPSLTSVFRSMTSVVLEFYRAFVSRMSFRNVGVGGSIGREVRGGGNIGIGRLYALGIPPYLLFVVPPSGVVRGDLPTSPWRGRTGQRSQRWGSPLRADHTCASVGYPKTGRPFTRMPLRG